MSLPFLCVCVFYLFCLLYAPLACKVFEGKGFCSLLPFCLLLYSAENSIWHIVGS